MSALSIIPEDPTTHIFKRGGGLGASLPPTFDTHSFPWHGSLARLRRVFHAAEVGEDDLSQGRGCLQAL